MEAKVMTKKQQNNHPETGYLAEIRTMISGLLVISVSCYGLLLKNYLCHGFKLFDSILKFKCLMIANIHSKFKLINSFTEIAFFRENAGRIFSIKKNTKFIKGAIRAFDFSGTVSLLAAPHGVSSGKLAKNAIKINNFFNVNEYFLRNNNNLTVEVV